MASRARSAQCRPHAGHRRHQHHRVERRGVETEADAEGFRPFRDRMHEQTADTDCVGRVNDPVRSVLKQSASQTQTLLLTGDGQPREYDNGDRFRHVAPETSRGCVGRHGAGCQRVVRNDLVRIADDECSRCPACLVRQRAESQPVIERQHAAVEADERVVRSQRLWGLKHWFPIRPWSREPLPASCVAGAR